MNDLAGKFWAEMPMTTIPPPAEFSTAGMIICRARYELAPIVDARFLIKAMTLQEIETEMRSLLAEIEADERRRLFETYWRDLGGEG